MQGTSDGITLAQKKFSLIFKSNQDLGVKETSSRAFKCSNLNSKGIKFDLLNKTAVTLVKYSIQRLDFFLFRLIFRHSDQDR